jgi:hypothetical protein
MLKSALDTLDLSSKAKRRKAAALVSSLLERLRSAEEAYMERIPESLQASDAYDNADNAIALLEEAIDLVSSVYD